MLKSHSCVSRKSQNGNFRGKNFYHVYLGARGALRLFAMEITLSSLSCFFCHFAD